MKKITRKEVKKAFPVRPAGANKGSFGRVLVVAGSSYMTGAAVLCAKSALKAGAGLVTLALPESRQQIAAAAVPEMITVPLPETEGLINLHALPVLNYYIKTAKPSLAVIGPGLGASSAAVPFMKQCGLPLVADADALNRLAASGLDAVFPRREPGILTPHPGEMGRLLQEPVARNEQARLHQVQTLFGRTGAVSLIKGHGTLVYAGEETWQNTTGGAALAKAGSGDVLCGLIAGLWAQLGMANGFDTQSAFQAALCGVYLHGLCGDLAAKELTDTCVLAGELLNFLPAAIKKTIK